MRNKLDKINLRKERVRKVINSHCTIASEELLNQKRYRLSLHKTSRHLYVQLIDINEGGNIICAASTLDYRNKQYNKSYCNKQYAQQLGTDIAKKILKQEISRISVDRGSNKYVGCVATLVDAIRGECGDKVPF